MSLRLKPLLPIALLSTSFVSAQSIDPITPLPRSMAAIGDSITAGALANFKRQDVIYPWVQAYFWGEMMAFLRDNRNMEVVNRRHLSWASGIDPHHRLRTHASRLNLLHQGKAFAVFNGAVSGAASEHIASQLQSIHSWSQATIGKSAPDYVTLLIGPNDVCADSTEQMTSTQDYKSKVYNIVYDLIERNPETRVLLSSIPNVESLRRVTKNAILLGYPPASRCEDLWNMVNLCPTLTTEARPAERAKVAQRVIDYNQALAEIAQSMQQRYGDRVRYSKRPHEVRFTANDLSIDCFHPNTIGQNKISEATWPDSWWTKEWAEHGEKLEQQERRKKNKK